MRTEDYLTFIKTFRTLDEKRWKLAEKKYRFGLTSDEHETLDWLALWTWHHRVYVKGNHDRGNNHKLEGTQFHRGLRTEVQPVRRLETERRDVAQG